MQSNTLIPPFSEGAALLKVRMAEGLWNTRVLDGSFKPIPRIRSGVIARSFQGEGRRSRPSWNVSGPGSWTIA